MKKRRNSFKILSLFASFVVMMFFTCNSVNAIYYQESENKITDYQLDREANKVKVSIQYQNGISNIQIFICETHMSDVSSCVSNSITSYKHLVDIVNPVDSLQTYNNEFITPTSGLALNSYQDKMVDGKSSNEYKIAIKARFCMVRDEDKTKCNVWDSEKVLVLENTTLDGGLTSSGRLNTTVENILTIINDIVIPILWVILGAILVIRGILLSIDIIKSSDEPEVRRRKVSGLIWLFIGIFVAFAVTIGASAVMSMFGYGGYF